MNRRRRIYEGKAKILYEGPEPGTLIQHFKDDATAFNNKKHAQIDGKGARQVRWPGVLDGEMKAKRALCRLRRRRLPLKCRGIGVEKRRSENEMEARLILPGVDTVG